MFAIQVLFEDEWIFIVEVPLDPDDEEVILKYSSYEMAYEMAKSWGGIRSGKARVVNLKDFPKKLD